MAIAIVVLSLVATLAMDKGLVAESNSEISKDAKALQEQMLNTEAVPAMPQAELPAEQPARNLPRLRPSKPARGPRLPKKREKRMNAPLNLKGSVSFCRCFPRLFRIFASGGSIGRLPVRTRSETFPTKPE